MKCHKERVKIVAIPFLFCREAHGLIPSDHKCVAIVGCRVFEREFDFQRMAYKRSFFRDNVDR